MRTACRTLLVMVMGISCAWAANETETPQTPLSEAGQKLRVRYADRLSALKAEISKAMPVWDEPKRAACLQARETEKAAREALHAAEQRLGEVRKARELVDHAKAKWIGGAEREIAKARDMLEQAATEAERDGARKELVKWQENREAGIRALRERQEALDKATEQEPKWVKELEAAQKALESARDQALKSFDELNLGAFLAGDRLDAQLAEYVVLLEATPQGLAEFAQQGDEQQKLVEQMLADADLLIQMLLADGAQDGKYGRAMEIYTDIQKADKQARDGVLQRLALAVSLEHAVPVRQRNATGLTAAPETVDPVKRYLHFKNAYRNHELDPGFEVLNVWDYRMVVNGEEPDEILAWGRKMLRNYRPDHITTSDHRWRYVAVVRTDIRYGSEDTVYDKPELQFFQNILMNGGVCGRRAFFGRFILRAFGVPTTARPQPGHAALVHWTPDGWVICLGAGWGHGWTKTRYNRDLDFLATTQARENAEAYIQVKRAQWIGDVMGEKRIFGFLSDDPDFWYAVSLYRQRAMIQERNAVALAAVGAELGEANESGVKYAMEKTTITEADRTIAVSGEGVITIPAAACSRPTESTGKILFMPSTLGGKQLHYSRNGQHEPFEYTFDAPEAGRYALTARVVTPSWKQHLLVTVNGAGEAMDIALPFTVGMWEKTPPVEIALAKGRNVLTFSREGEVKGVTIRDFALTPMAE